MTDFDLEMDPNLDNVSADDLQKQFDLALNDSRQSF